MQQPKVGPGLLRHVHTTLLLASETRGSVLAESAAGQHARIGYSPYGNRISRQPTQSLTGFNGQFLEPFGWYHLGNGHRTYNPMLRRFHSPDRLSPFGEGGLNAYAYCLGDPVNHVDPTGRAANLVQVATLIGIGIGLAAGAYGLLGPALFQAGFKATGGAKGLVSAYTSQVNVLLARYAALQPGIAGPMLGGLDAAASMAGLATLPVAAASTVEDIQHPMEAKWEIMKAAAVLGLFVLPVKGFLVPSVPKLATSKWGRRLAKIVHGRRSVKVAWDKHNLMKAASPLDDLGGPLARSGASTPALRSPTPSMSPPPSPPPPLPQSLPPVSSRISKSREGFPGLVRIRITDLGYF